MQERSIALFYDRMCKRGWFDPKLNTCLRIDTSSLVWYNEDDDTSILTKCEDPSPQQVISLLAILVQTSLLYYYKSTCFTITNVLQNQRDPRGEVGVLKAFRDFAFRESYTLRHHILYYTRMHTSANQAKRLALICDLNDAQKVFSYLERRERQRETERDSDGATVMLRWQLFALCSSLASFLSSRSQEALYSRRGVVVVGL
jgi:hypothetical protein